MKFFSSFSQTEKKKRTKKLTTRELKLKLLQNYLKHKDPGNNYISLANTVGLPRSTVRYFTLKWRQKGTVFFSGSKKTFFSAEQLNFVRNVFRQNRCLRTTECLKQLLNQHFNLASGRIKKSTLFDMLKRERIGRKRITPVYPKIDCDELMRERRFKCEEIIDYLNDDYLFIYIDESSFNLNNNSSNYAWGFKDKRIYEAKPLKSENYSFICAISFHGIEMCQVVKKYVDSFAFFHFFAQLANKVSTRNNGKICYFMDNL